MSAGTKSWSLRRLAAVGFCAAAPLAVLVLTIFDPVKGGYPICIFHALTGLHCPGCGTARALHQLLNGQWLAAIDLNAFAVFCLPVLFYVGVNEFSLAMRNRQLPSVRLPWKLGWVVFGAIVLFGLARNIPVAPFTILAP